jgi:hypothetical protein
VNSANTAWVKLYPLLGLAAIKSKRGGAWRVWTIAQSIDLQGSGSIIQKALRQKLTELGVGDRQQRRWISAALQGGFFRGYKGKFYLSGLVNVAIILDLREIGLPALVGSHSLVTKSWRARIWSAYLMTLHERPLAQITKLTVTGILPRTQQRYQKVEPGCARPNISRTDLRPDQIPGMVETGQGAYFKVHNKRVFRRLPDIRLVDSSIVKSAPKGRCRKAEKTFLSYEGRDPVQLRLFCKSVKQVKATERQCSRSELLPWHTPGEIYQLLFTGRRCNVWGAVPMLSL